MKYAVSTVFSGIDRVSATMGKIGANSTKMADRATSSVDRVTARMNSVEHTASRVTRSIAGIGIAAGASLMVAAKDGISFEESITRAAARLGEGVTRGTKEFDHIERISRDIGRNTEFSAMQASGAIEALAASGLEIGAITGALDPLIDLATVAGLTLDETASAVAGVAGSFNLVTNDAEQMAKNVRGIADALVNGSNIADTSVSEIIYGLKVAGGLAKEMGMGVESSINFLVTGATTVKGAEAGTALRNVISSLSAPSGKSLAQLQRVAGSPINSDGTLRGVDDLLASVRVGIEYIPDFERTSVLNDIFNAANVPYVLTLLNKSTEEFAKTTQSLKRESSSALAATIRDTTAGDMRRLASSVSDLSISFFSLVRDPMRQAIEKMGALTDKINDLAISFDGISDESGKNIFSSLLNLVIAAAKFAVAMVALKFAIFAVNGALAVARIAVVAYRVALSAFAIAAAGIKTALAGARIAVLAFNLALYANPVGMIIASVAALTAVIVGLIVYFDDIVDAVKGVGGAFTSVFSTIYDSVMFVVTAIADLFSAFDSVKSVFGFFGSIFGSFDGLSDSGSDKTAAPQVASDASAIIEKLESSGILSANINVNNLTGSKLSVSGFTGNGEIVINDANVGGIYQ